MRANKVKRNLTKKAESQSVKKLIARYEQVSSLYEHVQILFDDVQKEVGAGKFFVVEFVEKKLNIMEFITKGTNLLHFHRLI